MNIENGLLLTNENEMDVKRLNKNQYLISLFKEGVRAGKLNSTEVINIEAEIMDVLKELILRYTKGESTSATVETTENLLNSILYTLDFYLQRVNSPVDALRELKQKGVNKIYAEGLESLRLCVIDTQRLYGKIKRERLKVGVEAYNATLDEAIPCFFKKYNIVFESHNTMASIDYPLVFDDMRVRGISYIKNYLEHLSIETEFCRFFLENEINKVLEGFGRMCRQNYRIELINIFEILINNSIFSVLCGNRAWQLSITKDQYYLGYRKLKEEGINTMSNAVELVISDLQINNALLVNYINAYKNLLIKRISNALENDCLSSLIVVEKTDDDYRGNIIAFDEGERLNNKSFKKLVEKLIGLSDTSDKVRIIRSYIHSLQDFVDIFNSDCIYGEEFTQIFNTLSNVELAILFRLVFQEELRDDLKSLSAAINEKDKIEIEWQEYFVDFINNLNEDRKKSIEDLLGRIDYEEIGFY